MTNPAALSVAFGCVAEFLAPFFDLTMQRVTRRSEAPLFIENVPKSLEAVETVEGVPFRGAG
jgi:hypothetical protein